MNAADRVQTVLLRYGQALTVDQAILIAASEAAGNALDPYQDTDVGVILYAEALLRRGGRVRDAIREARSADGRSRRRLKSASRTRPELRQERHSTTAYETQGPGHLISGDEAARSDLVLLERHHILGPHATRTLGLIRRYTNPSQRARRPAR